MQVRPMLSAKLPCAERNVPSQEEVLADLKRLDWSRGFLCSPKIDGIRALKVKDGPLMSRTLKPIPNRFIQDCLAYPLFDLLDGELIVGKMDEFLNFNSSQSGIMSRDGSPYFEWWVFDDAELQGNAFWWRTNRAKERLEIINTMVNNQGMFAVKYLEHQIVNSPEALLQYEEQCLTAGYEGIMFRDPGGRYKSFPSNRSTFKQQGLIKLKRFTDAEAEIIGFEELQLNRNEPTRDNLGYQKRSAHKDGQLAGGTLGKLLVKGINGQFTGIHFAIGSGLDDVMRDRFWDNRETYLGKVVKYKYQSAGAKDAPRAPIFLGIRDPIDL